MLGRVGFKGSAKIVQGTAGPQTDCLLRLRPGQKVSVRIAESREDGTPTEVDQPRVAVEPDGRRRPDGHDAPRLDQERLRHPHGGMDASVDQRRLFRMGH